jgi:hypothetical protein
MRRRDLLLLLLLSAIAAITPLAYADLPDQLWLGGFYDGGDEDDAILHIHTHLAATGPIALYVAAAPVSSVEPFLPVYEAFAPFHVVSLDPSRGPPTS